jgi:hypothetical protein
MKTRGLPQLKELKWKRFSQRTKAMGTFPAKATSRSSGQKLSLSVGRRSVHDVVEA